jgi:hypothetical protein
MARGILQRLREKHPRAGLLSLKERRKICPGPTASLTSLESRAPISGIKETAFASKPTKPSAGGNNGTRSLFSEKGETSLARIMPKGQNHNNNLSHISRMLRTRSGSA